MTESEFKIIVTDAILRASGNDETKIIFSGNSMQPAVPPYVLITVLTFKNSCKEVFHQTRTFIRHTRATISVKCKGAAALDDTVKLTEGLEEMREDLRLKKISFSLISDPENRTALDPAEKNISRYDFDLEVNIYRPVTKDRQTIDDVDLSGGFIWL